MDPPCFQPRRKQTARAESLDIAGNEPLSVGANRDKHHRPCGNDPGRHRRTDIATGGRAYSGTPLPGQQGNVAITGHRDTFFRPLRNIRKDDEITLTTLSGSYRYRVDSTKVVEPEDTEVLDDSDDAILTLVTCYPFYFVGPAPKRFIVRAHRIPG